MAAGREALHHVPDPEADPAVHLHLLLKGRQLLRIGKLAPNQQIGGLKERALLGQLIDPVAAVGQQTLLAVDVAHRRLRRRHPLQTRAIRRSRCCWGCLLSHGIGVASTAT